MNTGKTPDQHFFARLRRCFALLGALGVFGLMYGSVVQEARAEGATLNQMGSNAGTIPTTSGAAPAKKNWRDQTEATCGVACRYHRANDNLTLQALYLITKLSKIDDAIQNGKTAEASTALGAFCTDGSEDVQTCFDRYKAFQRVALFQIRQSIGRNEDFIAHLSSGRKNDGTVSGDAISFKANADSEAYLPEIPTVSELEKSYLSGKLKPVDGKFSAQDIQKWSQELVGIAPKNQRYLDFGKKPVAGNPFQADKSKNQLHMLARDSSGMAQTDKAVEAEIQKSQKAIKEVAENQIQLGKDVKVITPKNISKDDAVSYESITEARSILNSRIAGDLKKEETRSPASDPKAVAEKKLSDAKVKDAADPSTASANMGTSSRDLSVEKSVARAPSGFKQYGDEERVKMPEQVKNSRYIRYNLNELFTDIQDSTK